MILTVPLCGVGLVAILSWGGVQGAVIVDVEEVGTDVVAHLTGTLDVEDVTSPVGYSTRGVCPSTAQLVLGPEEVVVGEFHSTEFTGPDNFGTGILTAGSSGSGDEVGFLPALDFFLLSNYTPGDPLNSTTTWSGKTIASLGMVPGTYTWTWTGAQTQAQDSFTVIIHATIPEPSTLILLATGALGLLAYRCRRRLR
jgi:hypothetical protein